MVWVRSYHSQSSSFIPLASSELSFFKLSRWFHNQMWAKSIYIRCVFLNVWRRLISDGIKLSSCEQDQLVQKFEYVWNKSLCSLEDEHFPLRGVKRGLFLYLVLTGLLKCSTDRPSCWQGPSLLWEVTHQQLPFPIKRQLCFSPSFGGMAHDAGEVWLGFFHHSGAS